MTLVGHIALSLVLAAQAELIYNVSPANVTLTVVRDGAARQFSLARSGAAVSDYDTEIRDRLRTIQTRVGSGCGQPHGLPCSAMERYITADIASFLRQSAAVYTAIVPSGAEALLRGADIVSISRPRSLEDIPFEALVTNLASPSPRYFVQDHAVVYLTRDAGRKERRGVEATRWPHALVAFADPDFSGLPSFPRLPGGAQASSKSASELLGSSDLHFGDEVSVESLSRLSASGALRDYEYMFISTHTADQAGQLALVFSPSTAGRYLTADDVLHLSLGARLVVVSACSSGAVASPHDTGSIGLADAFLDAGAREVIVARWTVMDSVEAVFVPKIFGSLGKGAASAQALQRAEITMIDGPTLYLRHPFFWAAMMLERQ